MNKLFYLLVPLFLAGVCEAQSLEETVDTLDCWKQGECSLSEALDSIEDWSQTPQTVSDVIYSIDLWRTDRVKVGFVIAEIDAWKHNIGVFKYEEHIKHLH